MKGWQFDKVISILQALIYLVKQLVDLISFPYLGHEDNLEFIISIVNCREG